MKKIDIKTKIIAAVLAAVTACSVSTMAMTTAIPVYAASSESERIVAIDTASAAVNELMGKIPGGKIMTPILMI